MERKEFWGVFKFYRLFTCYSILDACFALAAVPPGLIGIRMLKLGFIGGIKQICTTF